ncbi:efflux transporter outer membrane subunit [Acidocella sp. KAb 2-4]|uniref:efflux transporter outer membrane subunit n=1 Tax=Acidocella sp. KAb 2-4 TaxID=2885158 RepID=UPI001D066A87|nr:efflux transporter outer membrane subunit [Acidocella sp. KAb 2-4]MCB5945591.1 efflux transporter outer membrane subunit [Acidocella sp. KAb 2-4]
MPRLTQAAPLAALLLAGCTLIPAYQRPALPVADAWPAPGGAGATPAADIGWRDMFQDPALQGLIALSLGNNRNLRVAVLNIQAAEAQYRIDRASLFPSVDATASMNAYHTPAEVTGAAAPTNFREFSLGAGAVAWELDLFGKLRSKAEQARQLYLDDADTATAAEISLVAQVAGEYETWLADRESEQIAADSVTADQRNLQLVSLEAAHGEANAMEVAQAQTALDAAQTSVAQYQRAAAQDMDALVLLAGAPIPPALLARMQAVNGLDAEPAIPPVPAGLPSDLLVRRPDIRAAEHALLAANANIGAARAAFFPSISLTADGGTASHTLSDLFAPGSGAWSFAPQITLPIFTAGANFAALDQAKIEKRIEVANYEAAIQSAFHDVSDALNARASYDTQLAAQQNLVDADTRFLSLAQMRFQAGIDSYLNVLTAQNQLLTARLGYVSVELAAMQNNITLYKALGGGWQETSQASTAAKPSA